ncbi:hypothetical protein COB52_04155 [Candidatus Kaiserbacteria bacterium]|nr:MAG: hypothetical protein COB52_04155 [Candidatus Kaiserbacteria bacterium]
MGNKPKPIEDPDEILDNPAFLTKPGEITVSNIASEFFGIGEGGHSNVIVLSINRQTLTCVLESDSDVQKSLPFKLNGRQWQ